MGLTALFAFAPSINGEGACVGETDPLAACVARNGGTSRQQPEFSYSGAGAESGCGENAGEVHSEATSGWTRR
jgi:hypothetical protein